MGTERFVPRSRPSAGAAATPAGRGRGRGAAGLRGYGLRGRRRARDFRGAHCLLPPGASPARLTLQPRGRSGVPRALGRGRPDGQLGWRCSWSRGLCAPGSEGPVTARLCAGEVASTALKTRRRGLDGAAGPHRRPFSRKYPFPDSPMSPSELPKCPKNTPSLP